MLFAIWAGTVKRRFAFALFVTIDHDYETKTTSVLVNDPRYKRMVKADDIIRYGDWRTASYDRYRV